MNIALVSYEFPPATATGGIASYMHHLAVFLSENGHRVTVFSADPAGRQTTVVSRSHCTNYLIPAGSNEAFREAVVPMFIQFLQTNQVDIMESPEVGACALLIKERFPNIPLVVKMHTPGVLITKINHTYLPLAQKLRFVAGALKRGRLDLGYWSQRDKNRDSDPEYRICMQADTLLSPSKALKQWATRFWGIPAECINLVPNPFPVHDELFSLPLENRPNVVSFVGKLSVLKGMIALTEAIPQILQKNRNCKVFLVGRDEVENGQSMKTYMEERLTPYAADVVFTGALDKASLHEVYAQSKVCVFPSLWENYPTVILEAIAAGAVVAASDAGGIPELIANKATGLLFNPKQPKNISMAVNRLLENEEERIVMAKAARTELQKRNSDIRFKVDLLKVFASYETVPTTCCNYRGTSNTGVIKH